MAPSAIRGFDLMQKMSLERQCAAKGCCWDSTRYQQSLLMQPGNALGSAGNLMCAWRAPVAGSILKAHIHIFSIKH